MDNVDGNEITNLGGDFHYINSDGVVSLEKDKEVTLTLDSNTGKYYLEGVSTQDGTPAPDNPIEIVNTYKAGHYRTTINGTTYRFSLGDDLRSVGNVKDKFELDITNRIGSITKKVENKILNPVDNWELIKQNSDESYCYKNTSIGAYDYLKNFSSNYFICSLTYTYVNGYSFLNRANPMLFINISNISTVEELNNYLLIHNIYINYSLLTPIIESVEID